MAGVIQQPRQRRRPMPPIVGVWRAVVHQVFADGGVTVLIARLYQSGPQQADVLKQKGETPPDYVSGDAVWVTSVEGRRMGERDWLILGIQ